MELQDTKKQAWLTRIKGLNGYQWFRYSKRLLDRGRADLIREGSNYRGQTQMYDKIAALTGERHESEVMTRGQ